MTTPPIPASTSPLPSMDERKTADAKKARIGRSELTRMKDGSIFIGSFALSRQVLRSGNVAQAGFNAEALIPFLRHGRLPVIFQEGEAHKSQRSAIARFFSPKAVKNRYLPLMKNTADRIVERFHHDGRAHLHVMSLELSVTVAAEIVGLTHSCREGIAERLNSFFKAQPSGSSGLLTKAMSFVISQFRLFRFYWLDVRPAIRARRQDTREDVISHLISHGYSNKEILIECVSYGAAGMVTTREFIITAAWHLLEDDVLKTQFLDSNDESRIAMLEEILRLEPVVGTLYRRATCDFVLEHEGRREFINAGTLLILDIGDNNTDPVVAGKCPLSLDFSRQPQKAKVSPSYMSFGDGPHRCPGATVALYETSVFLEKFLRVPNVNFDLTPTVSWNPLIGGYELRATVTVGVCS